MMIEWRALAHSEWNNRIFRRRKILWNLYEVLWETRKYKMHHDKSQPRRSNHELSLIGTRAGVLNIWAFAALTFAWKFHCKATQHWADVSQSQLLSSLTGKIRNSQFFMSSLKLYTTRLCFYWTERVHNIFWSIIFYFPTWKNNQSNVSKYNYVDKTIAAFNIWRNHLFPL